MRFPLPEKYKDNAFMLIYLVRNKCLSGSDLVQEFQVLLIAKDKQDAQDFFDKHYLPTFDKINNKLVEVTIRPCEPRERFYRFSIKYTPKILEEIV